MHETCRNSTKNSENFRPSTYRSKDLHFGLKDFPHITKNSKSFLNNPENLSARKSGDVPFERLIGRNTLSSKNLPKIPGISKWAPFGHTICETNYLISSCVNDFQTTQLAWHSPFRKDVLWPPQNLAKLHYNYCSEAPDEGHLQNLFCKKDI